MKKTLLIILSAVFAVFTSCQKDYTPPTVSGPDAQNLLKGNSVELNFTYTAEAGFGSSSVSCY